MTVWNIYWKKPDYVYKIKKDNELTRFYLYVKTPKTDVRLSDYCCADKPPQKGENGEDVCPSTAQNKTLYVLCSGTAFMEVISRVMQKKPKANNEELTTALNNYLQTGKLPGADS